LNRLEKVLRRIHADLESANVPCALIGGLAVSALTEPRFTRDADLAVAIENDQAAESLVHSLQSQGYRVITVVEQEAAGRLASVRLAPPGEQPTGIVVDLLFASSGIEKEIVSHAEAIELIGGLVIPTAQIGHLIALKILSRDDDKRPQDIADLRKLIKSSTSNDIELARTSLELIVSRGYHRNRDLLSDFEILLKES
jgi:predicted nucleotidyltransferase